MPADVSVPVMGRIAAGVPIEAIQTRLDTIDVPPELLTKGEHFALEVKRRFHDRGRHPRRRHHHRPEMRGRAATATSSWRWSMRRKRR